MQAAREALYVQRILAKTGDSVLRLTLPADGSSTTWTHYPPGDVFDPATGAQWYYHSHGVTPDATGREGGPSPEGEHGHFHCFLRPEGAAGPVHHLIAVSIDAYGRLIRLFTVNQWVVGDEWLDAEGTCALLPRFDVQLARPSYLVNRWLSAVIRLYEGEISALVAERDRAIAEHIPSDPTISVRQDRTLEVTSSMAVDLEATASALGLE